MKISHNANLDMEPTWIDEAPIVDDTCESDIWYAETELRTILEVPGFRDARVKAPAPRYR